jgi:hypothetical protein
VLERLRPRLLWLGSDPLPQVDQHTDCGMSAHSFAVSTTAAWGGRATWDRGELLAAQAERSASGGPRDIYLAVSVLGFSPRYGVHRYPGWNST